MPKSNILLESGTNELEFIEFQVRDTWYGLNVAKIREIILMVDTIEAANMHPSVIGIFDHRGSVIPLIDLAKWFEYPQRENNDKMKILICELNGNFFGFTVDFINQIRRIKWSELHSPEKILACSGSAIIGVVKQKDKIVLMLDIEKIINDIEPVSAFKLDSVDNPYNINRENKRIFFADDSMLIRTTMQKTMPKIGYSDILVFENGKVLFDKLMLIKKEAIESNANLSNYVSLVVTDIEMPQLDGLHLIKKIREDEFLKDLPVVVFSSISNTLSRDKSLKVGANEHINKPDLKKLTSTIDSVFYDK